MLHEYHEQQPQAKGRQSMCATDTEDVDAVLMMITVPASGVRAETVCMCATDTEDVDAVR